MWSGLTRYQNEDWKSRFRRSKLSWRRLKTWLISNWLLVALFEAAHGSLSAGPSGPCRARLLTTKTLFQTDMEFLTQNNGTFLTMGWKGKKKKNITAGTQPKWNWNTVSETYNLWGALDSFPSSINKATLFKGARMLLKCWMFQCMHFWPKKHL